jgi:hypothetical protein
MRGTGVGDIQQLLTFDPEQKRKISYSSLIIHRAIRKTTKTHHRKSKIITKAE